MHRDHPTVRSAERQAPNSHKSDLRQWLHSRCTSNYFVFDRRFLRFGKRLKKLPGLFLQDLINLACLDGTQWDGEWFRATGNYLERAGWSKDEQKACLTSLRKAGFVTTEKRGLPPERWVTVHHTVIDAALAEIPSFSTGKSQWGEIPPNVGCEKHHKEVSIEELQDTVAGWAIAHYHKYRKPPGGDDMVLIPQLDTSTSKKQSKQSPPPEALDRAELLHEALHKARKCLGKWSRRSWGQWLAPLLKEYGTERVDRVLRWYCDHVGQQYVPVSYSARSFRDKFLRIEEAAARDAAKNPRVEVSPQAQVIVTRLTAHTDWPSPAKEELSQAVQLSLDSYTAFCADAKALAGESTPSGRFTKRLLGIFGAPGPFVEKWFEDVAAWIRRYPKARLIPKQVVSLDSEKFQELCRNEANEYGDARLWDRLYKELVNV